MKKEAYPKIDFGTVDWLNLLPHLGVDANLIKNPKRRGPCPIEQAGHTRFRFHNKDGRGGWICNCGAGDGIRLVALVHGITDADAVRMVRDHLYGAPSLVRKEKFVPKEEVKTEEEREKAKKSLVYVSKTSSKLDETVAMKYLKNRVVGLKREWVSRFLRFHPALFHHDNDIGSVSKFPALIGYVINWGNPEKVISIHRTYLSKNGEKAPVSPGQVKKLMTTTVDKIAGESIKVNGANSSTVIVSEGIENALAWVAATENKYGSFAAINCYNLGQFVWPKGTKHLVIAADNDSANPKTGLRPGKHYALILQERALKAGLTVELRMPPVEGVDFDDLWNEGKTEFFQIGQELPELAVC